DLTHYEWRLRDHFLWPVYVFDESKDVINKNSHSTNNNDDDDDDDDSIQHNLSDINLETLIKKNITPLIDQFSKIFVEDLDFPSAFDHAVSKSIKSQIELY